MATTFSGGRPTSITWWLAQRLSAVLLGPALASHIWWPDAAKSPVLNALILALVVVHGYAGIVRVSAFQRRSALQVTLGVCWAIAVVALGLLAVAGRADAAGLW